MKRILCISLFIMSVQAGFAQPIEEKLAQAVQQFEADSQMRHAIMSLYVADAKTGKTVYAHHEQIGLAPASTQKIFTSVAAFELLGKDYRYKTKLGYTGKINDGELKGDLYIIGSGDPTLGSWRWKETNDTLLLKKMVQDTKKAGITRNIDGVVTTNESKFSRQSIPGGWVWDDIGNYYGAGSYPLNWKENQYDVYLRSGNKVGDSVIVLNDTADKINAFVNELQAAAKGTGDNAYIYLPVMANGHGLIKGTIPVGEKSFAISGAETNPIASCVYDLSWALMAESIHSVAPCIPVRDLFDRDSNILKDIRIFSTYYSPRLDSINYWFLKKSVNLYGEALIKTFALEKRGYSSTEKGVELLKDFWAQHGIDKAAVNVIDGSGLSPQNRVTTNAEVKVLQYAKTRPWFSSFYNALPEFNGMKMKSGSIGGARAYTGYHTAANGTQYIFSIIVNNYDGSSSEAVRKIYRVLDILK